MGGQSWYFSEETLESSPPLSPPLPCLFPPSFQSLCVADIFWLTLKFFILEESLILLFKLKQGLPDAVKEGQREREGNSLSERVPSRGLFCFTGGSWVIEAGYQSAESRHV